MIHWTFWRAEPRKNRGLRESQRITGIGYSYVRYSSAQQGEGDSIRRRVPEVDQAIQEIARWLRSSLGLAASLAAA